MPTLQTHCANDGQKGEGDRERDSFCEKSKRIAVELNWGTGFLRVLTNKTPVK